MDIPYSHLKRTALFSAFSQHDLHALAPQIKVFEFAKGLTIVKQNSLTQGIFIIYKGRLKIHSLDYEHKETAFIFLNPGDFFGELSVIDGIPSSVNVETVEPSILLMIPTAVAKHLLTTHTGFNQSVLQKLANSLRQSNQKIQMLSAKSFGRVIYFLSTHGNSNLQGEVHGKMLTHDEIACMVNLSRETVSRSISQLQKQGYLSFYYQGNQKMFCVKPMAMENLHLPTPVRNPQFQ
ncbi:CarD family transcriptional regulator [Thiosulfatimonas sediminis]|uniref:CarD family transcriptional regulator n=1 Tax=Thiosulfatimonas sediminis TaxID=2675054 RepID=A0A6F8PSU0_9GAMM|nr:Crp/Fnr family transcriptional regulator [Thiosulfatimonas sediminis]BBP45094.1 CarD family transcriptional regulator [Thiosulfatimonas sediminis]